MESQIQRMKSSIANIQQNLKKLETQNQQTTKFQDNNENILPESLIHEDVVIRPQPSPKITQSKPNIIHTDIYTPPRHHLDDSQMQIKPILRKKALQYPESDQPLKKSKSQSFKTQYLYDGARVVYVPPVPIDYQDYGHIVIKTKTSHSNSRDSSIRSTQKGKKTTIMRSNIQSKRLNQHDYLASTRAKNTQRREEKKRKTKKYKVSEHPPLKIQKNVVSEYNIQQPKKITQKKRTEQIILKSCKTQCNLKKIRMKDPFMVGFKSETDSEFSDMEL